MGEENIIKIISRYVAEFIKMSPQELIVNPEEMILLGSFSYISKKSLKYITNSRQQDNYNSRKICEMIIRCGEVIEDPELCIPNNNKKYLGSMISARLYRDDGALMVVHIPDGKLQRVFNAFYRNQGKYLKMLSAGSK